MKKTILAAVAAMAFGFAGLAQAGETGYYVNLGTGLYVLNVDGAGVSKSGDAWGGFVGTGYDSGSNIAAELRIATTQGTDLSPVAGSNDRIQYAFSYLAKPYMDFSYADQDLSAYGLIGGTTMRIESLNTAKSMTALSFGAGLEAQVAENCKVGAEWMRMAHNKDYTPGVTVDADAFTLTASYNF